MQHFMIAVVGVFYGTSSVCSTIVHFCVFFKLHYKQAVTLDGCNRVQSSYFSDTISALTERDWVVFQEKHVINIMV